MRRPNNVAFECQALCAGEVLFIPSGWAHGVSNLEETVSVAVEVGDEIVIKGRE